MSIQPDVVPRSNVRRAIAEIEEYFGPDDPEFLAQRLGRPVESIIKLDANENPYGPSPLVQEMLSTYNGYSIYPDSAQRAARAALADYAGVPADSLILGNGADELIDLLMRAYLDPGDELIDFPPSFAMYAFNAQLQDARVVPVPRNDDFTIDVEAALGAITPRTKLILLTSPNNPTGTVMPAADVRRILETGYLVVLDEAYFEFADADGQGFESMIGEVARYPNLVVLRTFSKWAGLAGLRIGYGVFPDEVSQHLWKLKPPFNVNVAALVAMRAALEDKEHLLGTVKKIVAGAEPLAGRASEDPAAASVPDALQLHALRDRRHGRPHAAPITWPTRASWCATTTRRACETASGSRSGGPSRTTSCWRR